jgi:hypothetical protein
MDVLHHEIYQRASKIRVVGDEIPVEVAESKE